MTGPSHFRFHHIPIHRDLVIADSASLPFTASRARHMFGTRIFRTRWCSRDIFLRQHNRFSILPFTSVKQTEVNNEPKIRLTAANERIYGTRKIFPVYGSFTADPGRKALTSM